MREGRRLMCVKSVSTVLIHYSREIEFGAQNFMAKVQKDLYPKKDGPKSRLSGAR